MGTKVLNLHYRHTSEIFSMTLLDTLVFCCTLKSKKNSFTKVRYFYGTLYCDTKVLLKCAHFSTDFGTRMWELVTLSGHGNWWDPRHTWPTAAWQSVAAGGSPYHIELDNLPKHTSTALAYISFSQFIKHAISFVIVNKDQSYHIWVKIWVDFPLNPPTNKQYGKQSSKTVTKNIHISNKYHQ